MSILLNSPATSPASPAKWQKYKENAALKTLRAPTSSFAHMPQVSLPLTPLSPNTPRELHDFEKLSMLGKGSTAHVYLTRLRGTDQIFALKMMRKKEMLRRNRVQVAAPPKPSNRCASHAISNKPTLVVACQRVFNEREVLLTECASKDGAFLVPGLLRSPARACRNAKMVGHTLCVDHPFIISYHHCFQTDACLVFVLEYCGGGEFYQSAARSRRSVRILPSDARPRCRPCRAESVRHTVVVSATQRRSARRLSALDAYLKSTALVAESTVRFYAAEAASALAYLHAAGFAYRDLKPENILLGSDGTRAAHPI